MRKFVLMGLLCALLLLGTACAEELFVSPDGGDGVYSSITAALEAAQPGDTLVLGAGVYTQPQETFPILIDKQVSIRAKEGEEVILDGPPFKAIFKVQAPGVTIEGLNLHLRRWGVLALADELTLRDNNFVLIDTTYRVSSCGVWLAGTKGARIEDNRFTGCGVCLAGPPLSERSSSLPVLTGLFEVGEDIEFFTTHTMTGNTVNDMPLYYFVGEETLIAPTDAGELIAVSCKNVLAEGLDVSDASIGLIAAHCENVEIRDTKADRCGLFGVYLAKVSGGLLERVTSEGTNHGLDLRAVKNITVRDCSTLNCEQGIFLTWAENCLVTDCLVRGSGNGFFTSCGHYNMFTRCIAIDTENGFRIEKENDMFLTDTRTQNCTVAGVRMDRSSVACVGHASQSDWVGIIAYGGKPVTLYGNHFTGSLSCGLYLKNLVNSRIAYNVFEDSQKVSLQAEDGLVDVVFVRNVLDGAVIDHSGGALEKGGFGMD